MTNTQLQKTLRSVLKTRNLYNAEVMDSEYLKYEIDRAIGEINRCRNFTPSDTVLYDSKYEYLIIPMCVASISKIGAEGETSHSENGIVRYYSSGEDYPKELISQIIPLIK